MSTAPKSITVLAGIEQYITKIQERSDNEFQTQYPNTWASGNVPKYAYTRGKRFYKITKKDTQLSVFCFVDSENGDIYKAATWNAPAKGVRGNIFDEKLPLTAGALYK